MSEILIDVTRLLDRLMARRLPTGVDRVSLEYVRHFAIRARAVVRFAGRTVVLARPASMQLFEMVLKPSADFNWMVKKLVGFELCRLWRHHDFAGAFLFNTGHTGLEQASYPVRLRQLGVRPLFFIHDLIPITHPEYCRPGEADKHARRIDTALNSGAGLIGNSQATLDALMQYAQQVGKPIPPAIVAHLAPAGFPDAASARPMAARYFVMLGTIEARKNHLLILQLWRRMIEQQGEAAPRLVIIGQRGWECEGVLDLLERCPALRGFVTELPACTDAEVAGYLRHAQALLFPSFAEGYGMPLVEALSQGLPVIASDLPAFREIAGTVPDYVDVLDAMTWLSRIEAYAEDGSRCRSDQIKRLTHFAAPTWAAHFSQVDHFLERLA